MKRPFPRFHIHDLSHLQMLTTITRLVQLLKPVVTPCITMNLQVNKLESTQQVYHQLLARVFGSDKTAQINEADTLRDRGTKVFISKVKSQLDDFDEQIATDAQSIFAPIKKQGGVKLTRRPFAEQSAVTVILINELSAAEMTARMDRISVRADFERMVTLNDTFEQLWKERVVETAGTEVRPAMKEIRVTLENTLENLLSNVAFLHGENQDMISDTLIFSIRELIVEMESVIGHRETAAEKAKAVAELALTAS